MTVPVVTAVMPSYNCEQFIADSIASVISQTFERWELLIVDDASSDATAQLAEQYARLDRRIRLIRQTTNSGAAHARNIAMNQARGEFIAFIDSDDIWHPHKLEKQLAAMERHRADISYTAYVRRLDGNTDGGLVNVPSSVSYHTMLRRCLIGVSTAMMRTSTCGTVKMPVVRRRADHAYWLALLRDGSRRTVGIDEPLMTYRVYRESMSGNKLVAARASWKLLREVEGFDFARSLWLFSGYAFEAVKLRVRLKLGLPSMAKRKR